MQRSQQGTRRSDEVTGLLQAWGRGDLEARNDLIPLVYKELRRCAAAYLRRERADHTLQPTALVHEAYMRLVGQERVVWQSRAHFYGIAAQMMRRILVDHARAHHRGKRFDAGLKVALDEHIAAPLRATARQALPDPRSNKPLVIFARVDVGECTFIVDWHFDHLRGMRADDRLRALRGIGALKLLK